MMLEPVCVGRCLFPRSAGPVLAWRRWTIVYAAVSIPFKGFTRHWGLRDCTTLISFVSEPRKGSTLNTHCTNKPFRIEWRWGLSETLHLPQLFSTNMAVCAPPASQIQGTFPRFKGSPAFFHLCAPAHGQNHRLIFQNMFLACTPTPPSSHLPSSLYTSPPSFASMMPPTPQSPPTHTPSIISHTCSPFPVHHLFSSRPRPNPNLPASPPACSPKCVIFFHISSFAAPLLSSIQSPVQYVLWINKKWSWKVQSRQLRSQKQKDEVMKQRGRGAGCRLQSNFNEYQGEYPIFFFNGVSFWCFALNHCHTNKVFPIMPLIWLGNCVIPWQRHLTDAPAPQS